MRFGTWNIRSLYGSCSLTTVARNLSSYKLDVVGVQDVTWEKGVTVKIVD
jgi:exonuclease III